MPDYVWPLRHLKKLSITCPLFIIDAELAEFNAIRLVFPSAVIILCRWHVFEAIEAHVHQVGFIPEDEDWKEFKLGFHSVINEKSCDSLVASWGTFRDKWAKKCPDAVQYLLDTWLCAGRKEALCKAFFPETTHFEFFTTSP